MDSSSLTPWDSIALGSLGLHNCDTRLHAAGELEHVFGRFLRLHFVHRMRAPCTVYGFNAIARAMVSGRGWQHQLNKSENEADELKMRVRRGSQACERELVDECVSHAHCVRVGMSVSHSNQVQSGFEVIYNGMCMMNCSLHANQF